MQNGDAMKKLIAVFALLFSGFVSAEGCPFAKPGYQLVQVPDYWHLHQIKMIDDSQVFPPSYLPDAPTCKALIEDGRQLPERCYCDSADADPEDCIDRPSM